MPTSSNARQHGSAQPLYGLSSRDVAVFTAVVRLCAGSELSTEEQACLPLPVLRKFVAFAALSRIEAQPSPYAGQSFSNETIWSSHSAESRQGYASVADAWASLMQNQALDGLSDATRWAALTLFARLLSAIARAGRLLQEEYDAIRRTIHAYRRTKANSPGPSAPRQHYNVATGRPVADMPAAHVRQLWSAGETGGNGVPAADQQQPQHHVPGAQGRGCGSYSIYACLQECILLASSVLELDFNREAPGLVRPVIAGDYGATSRLVVSVLGMGCRFVTPRDVIESFFYLAAPRTSLRHFEGIAALQQALKPQEQSWLENPDFGLTPAAPIAGIMLSRAMLCITAPEGHDAIRAAEAECRTAAYTMVGRVPGPITPPRDRGVARSEASSQGDEDDAAVANRHDAAAATAVA